MTKRQITWFYPKVVTCIDFTMLSLMIKFGGIHLKVGCGSFRICSVISRKWCDIKLRLLINKDGKNSVKDTCKGYSYKTAEITLLYRKVLCVFVYTRKASK